MLCPTKAVCISVLFTAWFGAIAFADEGLTLLLPADITWVLRRAALEVFYATIYSAPEKSGPYAFRARAGGSAACASHASGRAHRNDIVENLLVRRGAQPARPHPARG